MFGRTVWGVVLVLACACTRSHEDGTATGILVATSAQPPEETTRADDGTSGVMDAVTSVDSEAGSGSAEVGSGDTTLIYDVGTGEDVGTGTPVGCQGKIDFLFVISRQFLMEKYQTQLTAAFPQFIETIKAKFVDFDYHIMVVDGDDHWGCTPCNEDCLKPSCVGIDYPCELISLASACDETIGAGTVMTAGEHASNKTCAIDGGRRYLTKGQADLAGTFACIAEIGSCGDDLLADALTAAMEPGLNGPGGCNEGFLRDDALLMVTVISNTWDEPGEMLDSKGTPEEWADAVLDAKGGDDESVVMYYIGYPSDNPGCDQYGRDGFCELAQMFPYGMTANILDDDYGPGFDMATDLVAEACAGFIPQ